MSAELMHDVAVRYDRRALDDAEIRCQEKIAAERFGTTVNHTTNTQSYKTDLVQQIEQARQKIQDAITSTEARPPQEVSPEPETPVSSEPVTPVTPTATGEPEEAMTKSKRKRERKKKARAAASTGTPTTPIATTKKLVAKAATSVAAKPDASDSLSSVKTSPPSQNATTPSTGNKQQPDATHITTASRPLPLSTKLVARPTDIQPIGSLIANNNNQYQPISGRGKNHMIDDFIDPETIKSYINRVDSLEQENKSLHNTVSSLQSSLKALEDRVKSLELGCGSKSTGKAAASTKKADSDDDIDLFGSDDEDEKPAPKPVAKPAAKKPAKAGPMAKSLIQLYVKPWDDETDMKEMEKLVRSVEMDGLVWGTSQLVPVGYGIKKLQIACVVEDDKVGTDDLEEKIGEFEDLVQSVDIASFNKL